MQSTPHPWSAGVLLVPSGVSLVWFAIFGGAAIDAERAGARLSEIESAEGTLFALLDTMPMATITSILVMLLVAIFFFVSGADAASIVMGSLSSRGVLEPSKWVVVFWGVATGAVAAIMLLIGGEDSLTGLQQVTIVAALPFIVIMIGMALALVRDLSQDPIMIRRKYAAVAVQQAVIDGVSEHGDDFVLSVDRAAPGEGVGHQVPTPESALAEEDLVAASRD